MNRFLHHRLRMLLSGCFALMFIAPGFADSRTQEVAGRMSLSEQQELRRLYSLQATALRNLDERADPRDLQAEIEDLFETVSMSLSSRTGKDAALQEWLTSRLEDIPGLIWLGELKVQIPVPVPLDEADTLRDRSSRVTELQVGETSVEVSPFWPNGALPTLTPEDGLTGPLTYVGNGSWDELDGHELRGAIALMHFKGARNWNRLFDLGVQAVVVIEDEYVSRPVAERFYANTPLPIPRFYVDRETGTSLIQSAAEGEEVTLRGGNWIENRMARSTFAWLPPHDQLEIDIRPGDLLARIAADFGVETQDLLDENQLDSPQVQEGDVLDIPGRINTYTVPPEDLLQRIARERGVDLEQVRQANPDLDSTLPPGTALVIPPLEDPFVLLVRTDSVSALPDLPHGAQTAGNIVSAVQMLRVAGELPPGTRRRGVLIGFLDGDRHGGRATREFLGSMLDLSGGLEPALVAEAEGIDDETLYARYLEVEAWLKQERESLDPETAEWFTDSWLLNQMDKYRVQLAEARVDAILKQVNAPTGADTSKWSERQTRLEEQITRLIEFRQETFDNRELEQAEKARRFLDRADDTLVSLAGVSGLTRQKLYARFMREVEEERTTRALTQENQETVRRVLDVLYAEEERDIDLDKPLFGWLLDLSSGSPHLQVAPRDDFRAMPSFKSQVFDGKVERMDRVQSFAALEGGWNESWSFIGNNVQAVFPLQKIIAPPSYSELWAQSGIGLIHLRTANDMLPRVDTPRDIPEEVNYEHLARQLRTAGLLFRVNLESPLDGSLATTLKDRPLSRLMGLTTKFNVRSGIDAKDPVPGTLVYDPAIPSKLSLENYNTATYMGNRIGMMTLSRFNGRYALPVETVNFNSLSMVHAYRPGGEQGLFDHVFDSGQIGTQKQSTTYNFIEGQDTYKSLILYEIYPFVISSGVDPLSYNVPATSGDLPDILDAVLNGTPRHINKEHPFVHFKETELTGLIVYMEPGRNLQMIFKRQGNVRALLLGDLPEDSEELEGLGLEVGPDENNRNLNLELASLRIAESMQEISDRRMRIYQTYGIRDRELSASLDLSREKVKQAEDHAAAKEWQQAIGRSREAWGILAKGYPDMLKLGREAVLSVVILMALLAPTAVFLEKLILGGKHIIARLGGTVGIFILGTLYLNFFHPAFKIAASPFIVVIAFTMILMAIVVLGICYQRFEVLVRRARIEGGEAESEEISLVSTLNTAFSLGVSNLKKRPTRTLLTSFTVTVLTFSIVSFVSVRGKDTLFLRPVPLDLRVQGVRQPVEDIETPVYNGALFREYSWAGLSTDFINAVETEFGSRLPMARRMHYIEVAGGNNATLEGTNQIEVRRGDRAAIVTALMGFEPIEREMSGLHRAVSHQQWFRPADEGRLEDRFHIILPDRVAKVLGITSADLVDTEGNRLPDEALPEVVMKSNRWKVIGILDTAHADRIRDVNAKSLALVDFLRSAISPSTGSGRLETEEDHIQMNWEDLAIVPVAARGAVGGEWNSLALKFPDGFDFESFRDELARRMDRAMFARIDGQTSLISARKESSVGGLAKVLVPIVLCVLIVSNTMMGTVEERAGEVQMLGAIGLSPSQISFLLLSESTVFSCIGIIFGTFAGLGFSQIVTLFPESLGQLSFNFTSLASTFLAMGTGAIVLIATLIPARKAAAMAAPSGMEKWELPEPEPGGGIHFTLPFTLTRGNAFGMASFFRRFLLNHVDSSSADFISKGSAMDTVRTDQGEGLRVVSHMWLAPYDLDVAQDLTLDIEPTGKEGVYSVTIHLNRTSGSEDAWMRTNYGFLNLVRKQFLLWRNLDSDLRKRYIREGSDELRETTPA